MIKAIETRYAGCRFRSRLEARWAVFFDQLGITWEYEPQGYIVGPERVPYLPDFWLPELGLWVEVKGSHEQLDRDFGTLLSAMDWGMGLPNTEESLRTSSGGILLLGPVPAVGPGYMAVHSVLRHHQGVYRVYLRFDSTGQEHNPVLPGNKTYVGDSSCGSWDINFLKYAPGLLDTQQIPIEGSGPWLTRPSEDFSRVRNAYTAARSARFEHGEQGA
ncbi:hypothetical protein ACFC01_17905 [Streptomyces mirabilis]|uniref:hypothetical protein n=1 Tax=Streptomyces mirabilis TaxID=68239 RepID=UPI0035D66A5F